MRYYHFLFLITLFPLYSENISLFLDMVAKGSDNREVQINRSLGTYEDYMFYVWANNQWTPTEHFEVTRNKSEGYTVSAHFEGEPGLYRIHKMASAESPYGCDIELNITREMNGIRIPIINKLFQVHDGSIQLKSSNSVPQKNVVIKSVYKNIGFPATGNNYLRDDGATNDNGLINLKFIDDGQPLKLKVHSNKFKFTTKEFDMNELNNGADWIIDEVPVQAVFDIFINQNGTMKKINAAEAKELFGSILLPIYVQDPVNKTYSLATNGSYISDEHNAVIFRGYIPTNKTLRLTNKLESWNGNFLIDSKRIGHFKVREGEIFRGEIHVLGEYSAKPPIEHVLIKVFDDKNSPLSEANVEVESRQNSSVIYTGITDEHGTFSASIPPDTYTIRIRHLTYKPLSAKVNLQPNFTNKFVMRPLDYLNINLVWDDPASRTQGELFLYTPSQSNPTVSVGVIDQDHFKLPLRSEDPVLLLFQSRQLLTDEDQPVYGNYTGMLEAINPSNKEHVIHVSKSEKAAVFVQNATFKACKIIFYVKWNDGYIPAGLGNWYSDKSKESSVRFPGGGTYRPLLIFDENNDDHTSTKAVWGEDLILDHAVDSMDIKPIQNTVHEFLSPFGYRDE